MEQRLSEKTARKKIIINGISLLFAVINISLVAKMTMLFYDMLTGFCRYGFDVPRVPSGVGVLLSLLVEAVFWVAGAFLFYRLLRSMLCQPDKRLIRHALFWGVLLAASYVMGYYLSTGMMLFERGSEWKAALIETACLSVTAASCIAPILRYQKPPVGKTQSVAGKRYPVWQAGLFYGIVIILCWLPVFLAYYPSVFAYDAEGQLYQVIARDYSTHHPLLHTLFLGAFFRLGGALGSYSVGMAVHSAVQMLLMAGAFAFVLSYLYQKGVARWQRFLMLAFYALFPTNSVLAISTTKDVLFSALVLLYTIGLYTIICDKKMQMNAQEAGAFVVLSVILLLFRNNAVYALIVSIPFVYAGCRKWQDTREAGRKIGGAKGYLLLTVAALFFFVVCGMGLRMATHAHSGSPREMLSVPLQQMARTRVRKCDNNVRREEQMAPELKEELEKYISSEWVFAAYDPHLADPVKNRAIIHDDPAGLIKTWIRLGMKYPEVYLDAFLDNSLGYWYLEDRSHAEIYGKGTESGFGYLSTDNRIMPAGCEIIPHSYLPGFRRLMEKIVSDNAYQRIPVLRIIFAPAFYWWMLCMYIAVALYRKKYIMILPVVFLVAYYFTLLLSPTVLIRYMYPFVVTVPAICCCQNHDLPKNDSENIQ